MFEGAFYQNLAFAGWGIIWAPGWATTHVFMNGICFSFLCEFQEAQAIKCMIIG